MMADLDRPPDLAVADIGELNDVDGYVDVGFDMGADEGSATSYSAEVLADNPLGYWRLGDMIAPTATNSVTDGVGGIYRNGAMLGATGLLVDDADTAVELDGEDDRIELDGFVFSGTAPFTLEAWVHPDSVDAEYQGIFSNEVTDGGNQGYGFSLNYGRPRFIRISGAGYDLVAAPASVSVDEPSHLVVTFDGFSILIFHNGVEVASGPGDKQLLESARILMVGARCLYNGIDEFDGVIDEVAIYDYPLPPARINAHYDAGRAIE